MRYYRGQRVQTVAAIDYYPYTIVSKGSTGTVVAVTRSKAGEDLLVNVALDEYHKGLAEWDNRMLLALDLLPRLKPSAPIKRKVVAKKARSGTSRTASLHKPGNHCRH